MNKKQLIEYFNNMKRLDSQGAPIDWYKVSQALVDGIAELPDPENTPSGDDPKV